MKAAIAALVLVGWLTLGTDRATAQAPAVPEAADAPARACRQAVLDFMAAVGAGDRDALRGLIHASPMRATQSAGVAHVIDCVVWQRALERAAKERWGADAAAPFAASTNFFNTDADAVGRAKVEFRDRESLVVVGPNVSPIPVRQTDGRWRVVLRVVTFLYDDNQQFRQGERGSDARLRYLDRVRRALFHVYWRVREQRIATADAARAELHATLAAAATTETAVAMEEAERAEFDRTATPAPTPVRPSPPPGLGPVGPGFNRGDRG